MGINKDDIITCEAGHDVARAKRDIGHEIVRSADFDWLAMTNPGPGIHKCPCGAEFMAPRVSPSLRSMIFHHEGGWRTSDANGVIADLLRKNGRRVEGDSLHG